MWSVKNLKTLSQWTKRVLQHYLDMHVGIFYIFKDQTWNFNWNFNGVSWRNSLHMCLAAYWWLLISMRRLLGGHNASQQFVEGSLHFTLLEFSIHLQSDCWKLEARLSQADSSASTLTSEVPYSYPLGNNTVWTLSTRLHGPLSPSGLSTGLSETACATKGGRRALLWYIPQLMHRIVLQALVKDIRRRPGLQSMGSWLTQWEASVNSYRQPSRLAVILSVGDGADSSEFAKTMDSHLPMTFHHSTYLVDPASSHMLVSKTKPCMSKYK